MPENLVFMRVSAVQGTLRHVEPHGTDVEPNVSEVRFMNIFEKKAFHQQKHDELELLIDHVELYLSAYDIEGMSIEEMMNEFSQLYAEEVSKKDFVCIAKSLGFRHTQRVIDGERRYILTTR